MTTTFSIIGIMCLIFAVGAIDGGYNCYLADWGYDNSIGKKEFLRRSQQIINQTDFIDILKNYGN